MNLSFKNYFVVEEERDRVAVKGGLRCSCGCEQFKIFHTGKQTKGILASHIIESQKQILIEAKCSKCGRTIQLYDSSYDGEKPFTVSHPEVKQFLYKNISDFKIKIILNYYEENYMTNKFAMIYIYLYDDNNKQIVLYE